MRERTILLITALVCAASRFLSLARSPWDWDEALLTMAMRDYDVTLHHPHPPGFPIYIAMGKLVRFFVSDDFRALQMVNILAAMLLFPAVYWFARTLRLNFTTSVLAGALFSFFPNVWFFGGGAFSDVPSIVLVLFAVTFLLRGAESRNAYWLGTLLLALAIGIRPQNFLVGLIPGLYATRKRRPLEVLAALAIGVTVVATAFGSAIHATGSLDEYLRMVREHGDYIARVDSWRSPDRPPLWRIFDRFFIKQYQSTPLSIIASIFAITSMVMAIRTRDRSLLWNALTFAPFAIFAWFMLDRYSISRFSIGYQPMFAVFVADGIVRLAKSRAPLVAAALIAAFIGFTWPALTPVRNEVAPSILAARAVLDHVDPRHNDLYVGQTMVAFMDLVAPGFPYRKVIDDRALPVSASHRPAWLLAEITETGENGFVFRRDRGNLWNISRRHYFEMKLQPLHDRPEFVSGWHLPERDPHDEWRWMGARSVTLLPAARGRTMLRLHFGLPGEVAAHNPRITIRLNGKVVDSFHTSDGYVERDYRVQAAPDGAPNTLELETSRTISTPQDRRELGLRLRYLAWGPA